jgi:alpha-galactosidase
MLAPTPPMGWNSWNTFGSEIHEDLVRQTADAFVEQGLKDAGYQYVVIDDIWEADERDANERLTWDPAKFPSGMKALADYVHDKGLKFGIYSCAGSHTCAGKPASFGYEETDAQTFAEWGVDFLKYDFCYKPVGTDGPKLYERMGQALRATGRPIVFSACEWGHHKPWEWAAGAGAHLWRTTGDIFDGWESIERLGFGQNGLERYAGPNHWNDPDMLVVGMYGKGNVGRHGCSDTEYRTHFSLWCMLASPLMIGCDVRDMNEPTRKILTAPEVIAINQDPLGRQGWCLGEDGNKGETWKKPLADGSVAVGLFNRREKGSRKITVAWEALGLHDRRPAMVRDLWAREDLGVLTRSFTASVEPHDVKLVRVIPQR